MDEENAVNASMDTGIPFSLKKEILTFTTRWTKLEGILLSEISQAHRERNRI